MGHNSPRYIHTIVEAFKLAFADRAAYYGDPDFSTIPIDGLIAKDYGTERAALIKENRAYPELPLAGNPWPFSTYEGESQSLFQFPQIMISKVSLITKMAQPTLRSWTRRETWYALHQAAAL